MKNVIEVSQKFMFQASMNTNNNIIVNVFKLLLQSNEKFIISIQNFDMYE